LFRPKPKKNRTGKTTSGFTYHTGKDEAGLVAAQVRGLGGRVLPVQADLADPGAASEDAGFVTGQVIYAAGGQRGPIRGAS
jgi:hypothetical protein